MDDLISRQAAITLPVMPKEHRKYQTFNLDDAYEQGWNDLQKCIEALPSVDRPTGEWIKSHIGTIAEGYFCTNCGKRGYCEDICPNCGANMKGIDDE